MKYIRLTKIIACSLRGLFLQTTLIYGLLATQTSMADNVIEQLTVRDGMTRQTTVMVFHAPPDGVTWNWIFVTIPATGWEHVVGTQSPNIMPWLAMFSPDYGSWTVPVTEDSPERNFQMVFSGGLRPLEMNGGSTEAASAGHWEAQVGTDSEYLIYPGHALIPVGQTVTLYTIDPQNGNEPVESEFRIDAGSDVVSISETRGYSTTVSGTAPGEAIIHAQKHPPMLPQYVRASAHIGVYEFHLDTLAGPLIDNREKVVDYARVMMAPPSIDPKNVLDARPSIENIPTDPEPRNAVGRTAWRFIPRIDGRRLVWDVEHALWYGSSAWINDAGAEYGRWKGITFNPETGEINPTAEYDAPFEIKVTIPTKEHGNLLLWAGVTVRLANERENWARFSWQRADSTVIFVGDKHGYQFPREADNLKLFIKSTDLTIRAASQYAALIAKEEHAHVNQWFGRDKQNIGFNPGEFSYRDVLVDENDRTVGWWKNRFVELMAAEGFEFDGDRRFLVSKTVQLGNELNNVEAAIKAELNPIFLSRRPKIEWEAKKWVGFREAYGYEHTYHLLGPPFILDPLWPEQ